MPATVLAAFFALTLVAPPPTQKIELFAGTWIAEFDGRAFVRLEMSASGGTLSGRIALGDIEVDSEGRVKAAATAPDRLEPIFDVVVKDSRLSFLHKDGNDTDRFEMHLGTGDRAELQFVLDEDTVKELKEAGIPVPKPVAPRGQWPGHVIRGVIAGARRPDGKARRVRILGIFERGATPPAGMPRPAIMPRITRPGH